MTSVDDTLANVRSRIGVTIVADFMLTCLLSGMSTIAREYFPYLPSYPLLLPFIMLTWLINAIGWVGINKESKFITSVWTLYQIIAIICSTVFCVFTSMYIVLIYDEACENEAQNGIIDLCQASFGFFLLFQFLYLFLPAFPKCYLAYLGAQLVVPNTYAETLQVASPHPSLVQLVTRPWTWLSFFRLPWPAQLSLLIILDYVLMSVETVYWLSSNHLMLFYAVLVLGFQLFFPLDILINCVGLWAANKRNSAALVMFAFYSLCQLTKTLSIKMILHPLMVFDITLMLENNRSAFVLLCYLSINFVLPVLITVAKVYRSLQIAHLPSLEKLLLPAADLELGVEYVPGYEHSGKETTQAVVGVDK